MKKWSDGTKKSTGNAFDLSISRNDGFIKKLANDALRSKTASESVNNYRKRGIDLSNITALSAKSANQKMNPKHWHVETES